MTLEGERDTIREQLAQDHENKQNVMFLTIATIRIARIVRTLLV